MNAFDFIKKIETSFDVTTIKIKDTEVWPFLRIAYFFTYRDKHDFKIERKNELKHKKAIRIFKNVLYGVRNYFKKYDFFIFSNLAGRRLLNGKYVNRLSFVLKSELGTEKVLNIENPAHSVHYTINSTSTEKVVSSIFFRVLSYLPFFKKEIYIENEIILKDISKRHKLYVNYNLIVTKFVSYVLLFKFIFRIYKPKGIFVTQYYSLFHQAAIYTCNMLGINTIELQHGVINNQHIAYNVYSKMDNLYFPKYLFVFGNQVKSVFNEGNYFINKNNVIPVGYMYIDYINHKYIPPRNVTKLFDKLREKYKKIVVVSSQLTIEKELIIFLTKLASLDKDILYIFVPRDVNKNYSEYYFQSNIMIIKKLNIYQIIKESNFHATVYSTCALEAPALGIPNILINIKSMAKKYYLETLTNSEITRFVDNEEQFLNTVLTWKPKSKKEIMAGHNNFYEQNHKENLKKALRLIKMIER
jgi:hypothetical protein